MAITTVKMLSRLEPRQRAYCSDWDILVENQNGNIVVIEQDGKTPPPDTMLPMTNLVLNSMIWKVIVKEITFQEAVKLVAHNRDVSCYCADDVEVYNIAHDVISFNQITNGKWYEGVVREEDFE